MHFNNTIRKLRTEKKTGKIQKETTNFVRSGRTIITTMRLQECTQYQADESSQNDTDTDSSLFLADLRSYFVATCRYFKEITLVLRIIILNQSFSKIGIGVQKIRPHLTGAIIQVKRKKVQSIDTSKLYRFHRTMLHLNINVPQNKNLILLSVFVYTVNCGNRCEIFRKWINMSVDSFHYQVELSLAFDFNDFKSEDRKFFGTENLYRQHQLNNTESRLYLIKLNFLDTI